MSYRGTSPRLVLTSTAATYSFIPDRMTVEFVQAAIAGVVEDDWRAKADALLAEREASGTDDVSDQRPAAARVAGGADPSPTAFHHIDAVPPEATDRALDHCIGPRQPEHL